MSTIVFGFNNRWVIEACMADSLPQLNPAQRRDASQEGLVRATPQATAFPRVLACRQ